ncbi:Aldehyde decarbonylase [Bienertia sinuspersici]
MELALLDYCLVPLSLLVMVGYHIWLLHTIIKQPTETVVGIHAINRRFWVEAMMEDPKNGVLAVQSLRNNIMASTLLATTAILLSSVIAVLMTSRRGVTAFDLGLGVASQMGFSIKFFSILVCFLMAFLLTVQSIRYYSHASILINVPFKKISSPYLSVEYVARLVNKGGYFWSLGLRAFYFSFPLFLWIFGPIPMFCTSIALVILFFFLDFTVEFRALPTNNVGHTAS